MEKRVNSTKALKYMYVYFYRYNLKYCLAFEKNHLLLGSSLFIISICIPLKFQLVIYHLTLLTWDRLSRKPGELKI